MGQSSNALQFSYEAITPHFSHAYVTVPRAYVDDAYNEAACAQKNATYTVGFAKGQTPVEYIIEHYKGHLTDHVGTFLYNFIVYPFLSEQLGKKSILYIGQPRLKELSLEPKKDALYTFEISIVIPLELKNWKQFPFKTPKRKNYKDIDRQVETFIKEETDAAQLHPEVLIAPQDWICFDVTVVNDQKQPLFNGMAALLWLKIGTEAADTLFQELFVGKKIGDQFYSTNSCFQDSFSQKIPTQSLYLITIQEIVPHSYFQFEYFKHHFKIKNKKDLLKKLTEVFSYRNDMTQHRAIIEESFRVLLQKHKFEPPAFVVLRQQQLILEMVQHNPDYHVYKTEKNFNEYVQKLAIKQLKEMMIIDQIIIEDAIVANNEDIRGYITCTTRHRIKEFLYFIPPETKQSGQEMPIAAATLKHYCLREKALNHVIHHLTKQ